MLALSADYHEELGDGFGFSFVLGALVEKVGLLEIVHHLSRKTHFHVDQCNVLVYFGNHKTVVMVVLLFDQFQGLVEKLKGPFLAIGFEQQQCHVVIGSASFFLSQFGAFEEAGECLGGLVEKVEVVGGVEVDVGKF